MEEIEKPLGLRPVHKDYPITSPYGVVRKSTSSKLGLKHTIHRGVDFGCPKNTPVRAYRAGRVIVAREGDDGFGKRVWVEHYKYKDGYCHLNEYFVNVGDTVQQGQVVGLSGETGKCSGPHLHFEVRTLADNEPVEPMFYETV